MAWLKRIFCSFWVILPLVGVYALACAVATFIENDYGTSVANALVYRTWWFNLLHVYFALALLATLVVSRAFARRKYGSILLHLGFVVIIIGAGVTRFLGFEGMMHIREGASSSTIVASDPTLNILALKGGEREFAFLEIPLNAFSSFKGKSAKAEFFGKELVLSDFEVKKLNGDKKDDALKINLKAQYDGEQMDFALEGGGSAGLNFAKNTFKDTQIYIGWGAKNIPLPFEIALKKFELERYVGSNSPSSYASEVEVLGENKQILKSYRIFMNNVLDFEGYRFYQSSYDGDEKGTILSVNKDPGKNITYLGYGMLILGAILMFVGSDTRFRILARFLQSQRALALLLCAFLAFGGASKAWAQGESSSSNATPAQEQPQKQANPNQPDAPLDMAEFVENFKNKTKLHAKDFATLQLQNITGRMEPVDSVASNVVHKITKKDNFLGLNNMQMFLGMMLYPQVWRELRIIYVNNDEVKKIIGMPKTQKYAAFMDFFGDVGYRLNNFVEDANRIDPAKRGVFEKDLLKVDERVSLVYSIFSGSFLRIFPSKNGDKWLDPMGISQEASKEVKEEVSGLLRGFFVAFDEGLTQDKWENLAPAIAKIKDYQKEHGGGIYLSDKKVQAEIFLNHANFFSKLILPYILVGLMIFGCVLICIIKNKIIAPWAQRSLYALALLCVLVHTAGLLLRWYVSEHSPWSNAYESMLYVTWASGVAGVVFFRRYNLALAASMFLGGIGLFVANLGFMDPQITPLVPVLKSYWLNIHVSIITASYGFLALCFILGLITLVLFACRGGKRGERIDQSILSLCALNEMSMIIGILMLSVGNFLGGVWANESWGRYWSWDPKETWALISIGVYAIVLHIRFLKPQNLPYIFSLSSVVAFYSILMTYFGVNYYLSGMHSYGAGDPVPIPSFVYYFVAATILLLVVSSFKRHLQSKF